MYATRLVALLALPMASIEAQEPVAEWRLSERPVLSIGSQDKAGAGLFGKVAGAVRQSTGAVVVADAQAKELRFFSSTGTFLRTAGRDGAGPGEFRLLTSLLRCAGDSTFVYDTALLRITVFSPTGSYVRVLDPRGWSPEPMPPYDVWCNTRGSFAAVHRSSAPPDGVGPRRPSVAITVVTANAPVVKLGAFPASERYFVGSEDIPRPLGKRTSIGLGSSSIYVGTGDTFEVVQYSLRGDRIGVVREQRAQVLISSAHVTRYIQEQVDRRDGRGPIDRRSLEMIYRDLEYPKWFPAYGKLLVDSVENLWVEDYPIPGAKGRQWSVFSKDHIGIAVVHVPIQLEVLQIGSDWILGVWKDELDTEHVRLYGLVR